MRTFYIFKIKKPYVILTKDKPYHLFNTFNNIYHLKENELKYGIQMFEQIKDDFNKDRLNNSLFNYYKDKYNYSKINNVHKIYDYYTKEKSKLIINKTYLVIKSTKDMPTFFYFFAKRDDMFVCDFKNKDYFWLEGLS